MKKGMFYGVGLGPGDPELVTLKALRVLQGVGRIYAVASRQSDRSVSGAVLLKTYRTRNRLLEALPPEARVLYGANLGLDNETYSSRRDEIDALPEAYLSMLAVKK